MSLVPRVGDLLGERCETLEIAELPVLRHERVASARVVQVHLVKENGRGERFGIGRNVAEDLVEVRSVGKLTDGEAAE